MRIMALDVGDSRIGVALSDPLEMLASPLTIIKRLNEASDIQSIVKLVNEHQVGKLLVGLPLSLSGDEGMQAQKVKAFAEKLTGCPLHSRWRWLTSVSAPSRRAST